MINEMMQELGYCLHVDMYYKNQIKSIPSELIYAEYEVVETKFPDPIDWHRIKNEIEDGKIEIITHGFASFNIQCNFLHKGDDVTKMDELLEHVGFASMWLAFDESDVLKENQLTLTGVDKKVDHPYNKESLNDIMKAGFSFTVDKKLIYETIMDAVCSTDLSDKHTDKGINHEQDMH